MSKALYDIYRERVFALAATMVVKHHDVALAVNRGLVENGYTIQTEPVTLSPIPERTWKYYKHIAGEYHESDTVMKINVAGPTGPVEVDFTKELIQNDPVLAYEYRYGTLFYNTLVETYPLQETLINGILNPVDIDIAIDAKDGDILYAGDYFRKVDSTTDRVYFELRERKSKNTYNNLIEDNEVDIINDIEFWIKGFLSRWHNRDYTITDDLYIPALLGTMYMQLPSAIMNLRLANCKTPKAHSYHIREYLESHGKLAQYIPLLSKKQSLYLYRNVRWIETNVGRQETFKELIESLMTESGISVYGYEARHKLTNLITTVTNLQDAANGTIPDVTMVRQPINLRQVGAGSDDRTVREVLEKEAPLSREGGVDLDNVEIQVTDKIATCNFDDLNTKVVESIALDTSERTPFPFSATLLNLWIYYAAFDIYNTSIYFTVPTTNERKSLTPKNALILFFYCYNKGYSDIELVDVPTIGAALIPRQETVRVSGLPVLPTQVSDFFNFVDLDLLGDDLLTEILDYNIPEVNYTTSSDFYNFAEDVHAQLLRRYNAYVRQEHRVARAHAEYATRMMYWEEVPCNLVIGTVQYATWLDDQGFDFTGMQPDQYRALADELLANGTGAGPNANKRLRDLQNALTQIMRKFSSYSVQFIQTIVDSELIIGDGKTLRLGDIDATVDDSQKANLPLMRELTSDMQMLSSAELGLFGDQFREFPDAVMNDHYELDVSIKVDLVAEFVTATRVNLGGMRVMDLTSTDESLTQIVPNNVLDGFYYPDP